MKVRTTQDSEPCPLCGRPIVEGPGADRHHWLPKSRGGRASEAIHVICHRQLHSVLTPKELAADFGTPEAVRAHPEIAKFIRWIRRKPPGYIDRPVEPHRVLIVEGILIFTEGALRNMFDVKIFVDTDPDLRFIRRLERDISERDRSTESVIKQYLLTVRPMHLEFVEPSKRYADVIIPEGGFNRAALDMVVARIEALLK